MKNTRFLERGVVIPCPDSVEIDEAVNPENIAPGVVIHAGSKIIGPQTSIGPGCEIGSETPATVENCQLGQSVLLKGGYFSSATFLDRASMGSGAHVRSGTLMEEESSGAHTVGLKQTIFLPFVTAGSLINFCDCLMAGGTSRKNHSEIGSSYIHFNFTPRQDKATASLIGDVPRGVMLNNPPIFLGGQGGLVGPARIAYGTIVAAGTICRQDVLVENQLFIPPPPAGSGLQAFDQVRYWNINRIVKNNLIYIGNLHALKAWYRFARSKYMSGDVYSRACWAGAIAQIDSGIRERIKRMRELAEKMPRSLEAARSDSSFPADFRLQQEFLINRWPEMEQQLGCGPSEDVGAADRDLFLTEWDRIDGGMSYIDAVARLSPEGRTAGTAWLQTIVDSAAALWNKPPN